MQTTRIKQIQWKLLNGITDNRISWLMGSNLYRLTRMTLSYLVCYTEAHLLIIISRLLEKVWLCPKVISLCGFQCTIQKWRYKQINVVKTGKTKLNRFYFSHKTLDLMENRSNHINSKWSNIYNFFRDKIQKTELFMFFQNKLRWSVSNNFRLKYWLRFFFKLSG